MLTVARRSLVSQNKETFKYNRLSFHWSSSDCYGYVLGDIYLGKINGKCMEIKTENRTVSSIIRHFCHGNWRFQMLSVWICDIIMICLCHPGGGTSVVSCKPIYAVLHMHLKKKKKKKQLWEKLAFSMTASMFLHHIKKNLKLDITCSTEDRMTYSIIFS